MAYDYAVGDIVRVKDVDELRAEYETDNAGWISTPTFGFPPGMHYLCGQVFHIRKIVSWGGGNYYLRSEEGIENRRGPCGFWYISPEMVEPLDRDGTGEVEIDAGAWLSILSNNSHM